MKLKLWMEGFGLKIDIKKWQQLDWGIATEKFNKIRSEGRYS